MRLHWLAAALAATLLHAGSAFAQFPDTETDAPESGFKIPCAPMETSL